MFCETEIAGDVVAKAGVVEAESEDGPEAEVEIGDGVDVEYLAFASSLRCAVRLLILPILSQGFR
ncbi:hypothetical protein BGZ72_001775 [Mortierella alpina]|nr:hypothetical protein BGZ72_001775 [Mortierella alpina]